MTEIITCATPFCSKKVKTNDFRFLIRSGEKVLQQKIITYTCNIAGNPIKEESVEWRDIETVDSMELKETKSQNAKNEQQNDLCTTSEQLTEQWKRGELPFGAYYVNRLEEHRIWLYQERAQTPDNCYEIYEILERVPSYEEVVAMKDCLKMVWEAAEREVKLKKLLKECREHLITYKRDDLDKGYVVYDGSYLIDKINQVLGEE